MYLASTSPRRSQLLGSAGVDYRPVEPGPEVAGDGPPVDLAQQRAASKARGARVDGPDGWVLGVDTVVEHAGDELGKPRDRDQARRHLRRLAGADHVVHTALCLIGHPGGVEHHEVVHARVRCRELADEEIERYLATDAWRGKAGAYGIQDEACDFMEIVEGDLDTVIGLPLATLARLRAGVDGALP